MALRALVKADIKKVADKTSVAQLYRYIVLYIIYT